MAQGAVEARAAAAATDERRASLLGETRRLRRHGPEPGALPRRRPALPRDDGATRGFRAAQPDDGLPGGRLRVRRPRHARRGRRRGALGARRRRRDVPALGLRAARRGWLYDADARTYDTAAYYRDVVLSPPPFHSATWAPANCRAQVRSDVFAQLRRSVDDRIERAAHISRRRRAEKPFVLVLTRRAPTRRRLLNARRTVHNLDAVVDALRAALPSVRVRVVSTAVARPWARQVALWRRARVVVGLHGGALAHALVPRARPGPRGDHAARATRGHPSMFAHMAVGVGAAYAGVLCRTCSMARGGAVDVEAVVRVVREGPFIATRLAHFSRWPEGP